SNRCGISSHVMEMVGDIDAEVHYVVVQEDRMLSDAIAERTGYRHHTPQAFVIRAGKPAYHATHYGINTKRLEEMSKGNNNYGG
ncbi:MAG TPA: monothiol bacilliredoxin BrxC family protein, partial [Pyrinomonadaceae bacterium]|nr:monothiol bacilliredoxin BrxC family protein [Pyrinomonadaceae bacterium]